jgi:hypothetical protein
MENTIVHLDVELTLDQARKLALFLARCGYSDFRDKAQSAAEAYAMRNAAAVLQEALDRVT